MGQLDSRSAGLSKSGAFARRSRPAAGACRLSVGRRLSGAARARPSDNRSTWPPLIGQASGLNENISRAREASPSAVTQGRPNMAGCYFFMARARRRRPVRRRPELRRRTSVTLGAPLELELELERGSEARATRESEARDQLSGLELFVRGTNRRERAPRQLIMIRPLEWPVRLDG